MWTSMRTCQWVEPLEGATGENAGVLFYRNRNGIGLPPAKLPNDKAMARRKGFALVAN
jgi:omega-6 fatty acid desaturase / acyl-lipid omega-6 desaturase (Delta-12 desaturase)